MTLHFYLLRPLHNEKPIMNTHYWVSSCQKKFRVFSSNNLSNAILTMVEWDDETVKRKIARNDLMKMKLIDSTL